MSNGIYTISHRIYEPIHVVDMDVKRDPKENDYLVDVRDGFKTVYMVQDVYVENGKKKMICVALPSHERPETKGYIVRYSS